MAPTCWRARRRYTTHPTPNPTPNPTPTPTPNPNPNPNPDPQALYEEIGEAAQVQLMMRRQGSLYLAAAIREALAGRAASRAAASRLTLGWG